MNKIVKRINIIILAALSCLCMAFAIGFSNKAFADEPTVNGVAGSDFIVSAAVRVADDEYGNGIRFTVALPADKFELLLDGSGNIEEGISTGVLLTSKGIASSLDGGLNLETAYDGETLKSGIQRHDLNNKWTLKTNPGSLTGDYYCAYIIIYNFPSDRYGVGLKAVPFITDGATSVSYDANAISMKGVVLRDEIKDENYRSLRATYLGVTPDYKKITDEAVTYAAGEAVDTGVKINFAKDFVIETTVNVSALNTRYVIANTWDNTDPKIFLNIEIYNTGNYANNFRVQIGKNGSGSSWKDYWSVTTNPSYVAVANTDYLVKFVWTAEDCSFNLFVNDTLYISGTHDFIKGLTSSGNLFYGGGDVRKTTFGSITVKGFKFAYTQETYNADLAEATTYASGEVVDTGKYLDFTNDFTIETDIVIPASAIGTRHVIANTYGGTGNIYNFLNIEINGTNAFRVQFGKNEATSSWVDYFSTATDASYKVKEDTPYNVKFVWTAEDCSFKLFVNGTLYISNRHTFVNGLKTTGTLCYGGGDHRGGTTFKDITVSSFSLTTTDLSETGYDGTVMSSNTYASGTTVDTGRYIDFGYDFLIETTIITSANVGEKNRTLIAGTYGAGDNTNGVLQIEIGNGNATYGNNFRIQSINGGTHYNKFGGSVAANTEYQIKFYWTANTNSYELYANGALVLSDEISALSGKLSNSTLCYGGTDHRGGTTFKPITVKNFSISTKTTTLFSFGDPYKTFTTNTGFQTGIVVDFSTNYAIETEITIDAAGSRYLIAGMYKDSPDSFINLEINQSNKFRVQYTATINETPTLKDATYGSVAANGTYKVRFEWYGERQTYVLIVDGVVLGSGTLESTYYSGSASNQLCFGRKDNRSGNSFTQNITVNYFDVYQYE